MSYKIKKEDEYRKDDRAVYHESGSIFSVKVLSNESGSEFVSYDLEILDVIQVGGDGLNPPRVGDVFGCEKVRGVSCAGLWHLMDS